MINEGLFKMALPKALVGEEQQMLKMLLTADYKKRQQW
jgi:hypothetical protein